MPEEIKPKKKQVHGKINPIIVAKGMLEGKKFKDIAVEAGSLAKSDDNRSGAITGLQRNPKFLKLLDKMLSDKLLTKVHKEGLEATKTERKMVGFGEGGAEYEDVKVADFGIRHKYLETGYKIKDKFPQSDQQPAGSTQILNLGTIINASK